MNELNDQPAVEAYLRATLGNVYRDLGEYTSAEAMHRDALALRKTLFGDEHPDVAASLHGLAEDLRNQHRFAEAEPVFQQALAMRRTLLGEEHLDVAQTLFHLGLLFDLQNNGSRAEPFFRQALALQRKFLNKGHPSIAETLDQLGLALTFQGKYEVAETMHREALAIRRKLYGDEHPEVLVSHQNFALLLASQGKYDEAEELFREILMINRKRLGDAHPSLVHTLQFFAQIEMEQGKFAEAEELFREALVMRKKVFGDSANSRPVSRLFELARACEAQNKLREAEEFYREVIAKDSKELRDRGSAFDGLCLAMAHWKLGHKDEARKWYEQAVEWMETNNPNNEELRRFRAEAAELLGITEPQPTADKQAPDDQAPNGKGSTPSLTPTTSGASSWVIPRQSGHTVEVAVVAGQLVDALSLHHRDHERVVAQKPVLNAEGSCRGDQVCRDRQNLNAKLGQFVNRLAETAQLLNSGRILLQSLDHLRRPAELLRCLESHQMVRCFAQHMRRRDGRHLVVLNTLDQLRARETENRVRSEVIDQRISVQEDRLPGRQIGQLHGNSSNSSASAMIRSNVSASPFQPIMPAVCSARLGPCWTVTRTFSCSASGNGRSSLSIPFS